MFSLLKPGILYTDTGRGITENDIDVVSDLWDMDGREVYRGSRDPRYTHANVYWLYDENLERVGLTEHAVSDHADFRILWFKDSDFGTLLQEDGWETKEDIWSFLPPQAFNLLVNREAANLRGLQEHCLYGPARFVTLDMVRQIPNVYTCSVCKRKSFSPQKGCTTTVAPIDIPNKEKVFFVDDDFIVHVPPPTSSVWSHLLTPSQPARGGDSSQAQPREQQPREQAPVQAPVPLEAR